MKTTKIKILITYKNKEPIIESEIISPIQAGRAIAKDVFSEMIGDDTGDNISERNPKFSELSSIYWAWKNYDKLGNPDYIGFMHYRRQFIFNEKIGIPFPKWTSSYFYFPTLHEAFPFFADEDIEAVVPKFDYIIPKYSVTPTMNIRDEYIYGIPGSRADIFDTFIEICREIHPDWEEEIKKIEEGNVVSVCNMFVMTKKLFFDYCKFAFPVLFELEKRIDATNLSTNGLRFCGYMAEKLQTMYTFRLEKNRNLKEKFCNCTYIRRDIRRNDVTTISDIRDCNQLRNELANVHFPNINNHFAANELQTKLLFVMHHLGRFKAKKAYYGIKKAFAFGEKHKKYQQKYDAIKALIKDANAFKKQLFKV
ncbi:MAG: DUF4422 domain-containing protein [Alphaproteobacteria bacterium]|nr:DUF4422 domain-containing protein [Alphaproteobacteria bacterium]